MFQNFSTKFVVKHNIHNAHLPIYVFMNVFYIYRAETLAVEIKEFQGQLADYNMVFGLFWENFFWIFSLLFTTLENAITC